MLQCDLFVAILPLDADGNVIHSGGTSIELGWASAMGKPIILVCDPAPKYSHLVIGLDAVAKLTKIDINRLDLAVALCDTIRMILEDKVSKPLKTRKSLRWSSPRKSVRSSSIQAPYQRT